jgi:hypothetical protein
MQNPAPLGMIPGLDSRSTLLFQRTRKIVEGRFQILNFET